MSQLNTFLYRFGKYNGNNLFNGNGFRLCSALVGTSAEGDGVSLLMSR